MREEDSMTWAPPKRSKPQKGWPKPKRPKLVRPSLIYKVEWECHQVTSALAPSEIVHGMRVGFCEHAMRTAYGPRVPKRSRFVLATVSLSGDGNLMTLTFDAHPDGIPNIVCGRDAYARFCISAT